MNAQRFSVIWLKVKGVIVGNTVRLYLGENSATNAKCSRFCFVFLNKSTLSGRHVCEFRSSN